MNDPRLTVFPKYTQGCPHVHMFVILFVGLCVSQKSLKGFIRDCGAIPIVPRIEKKTREFFCRGVKVEGERSQGIP